MSKNMTRKGLAFGAGLSLVASGFAGLPANAAGIGGDFVTLAPVLGDQYAVHLSDAFDLQANWATGVKATGQDLKFLVTDPNSALRVDVSAGLLINEEVEDDIDQVTGASSSNVITLSTGTNDQDFEIGGAAMTKSAADYLYVVGLDDSDANGFFRFTEADGDSSKGTITYTASGTVADGSVGAPSRLLSYELTADAALDDTADALGNTTDIPVAQGAVSARAADGSFVVNSKSDDNTNPVLLRLIPTAATTTSQTVTVTAWVDANDNGSIDATEYVSDTQTVKFMDVDDITAQASLVTPNLGDDALTATVVTTPVLNGAQLGATGPVRAAFTRAGSDSIALSDSATQAAVTGTWTATVTTEVSDTVDEYSTSAKTITDGAWNQLTDAVVSSGSTYVDRVSIVVADEVATATTYDNGVTASDLEVHNLLPGDKVTFGASSNAAWASEEFTVLSVPTTSTFTFAATDVTDGTKNVDTLTNQVYTVTTWGSDSIQDRVSSGDYSAQAAVYTTSTTWTLSGTKSVFGTLAASADDVYFQTAGSSTVQGRNINTGTDEEIKVKAGTTSVSVTLQVVDEDGAAVGAGRSVLVDPTADSGSVNLEINGVDADKNISQTLVTDANGQVALTITDTLGSNGTYVTIDATPEGVSSAISTAKIIWATQTFSLVDLNTTSGSIGSTRTIAEGGSYTMNMMIADQWYQAPADGTYRIVATGEGVSAGVLPLVGGKTTATVTDAGVKASYDSVFTLQKLTAGVWGTSSTTTITNYAEDNAGFLLNADGQNLYGGTAADLSDAVAAVALVELDKRTSGLSTPLYANDVVVSGKAVDAGTNVALNRAEVTVSGSSSILFENDNVASRGSLTFLTGTDGTFTVKAYSTTAMVDSVVTLTVNGVSKTVKVTFTGIGVGEGTSLVVTTPAAVKPASTFQVKAKLADVYGNGVDTAAGRVKVTYTGPGIVFGTLPTETDANGELQFSVLLGSNDTGNVVVTVSYDQNGDADYVDAKDLTTTATTEITASGVASSEQKVNAGSFKGYVALYAKGYAGQRMSAKVGKDWVVVPALASDFERVVEFTGAGVDVAVRIYIDRVLMDTINLTTK